MMGEIRISDDAPALMHAAAAYVVDCYRAALESHGYFTIALSGGSTPRALFQLLASPEYAAQIDWTKVEVFWGDERSVPPDHPDSNYRMANEALLSHVAVPEEHVHRIRAELAPKQAAMDYERVLRDFFDVGGGVRFDLILLGMGPDGHTASLFPGTAALDETERLVTANWVDKFDTWRITLTLPVLNGAANVAFLVSGSGKAEVLKRVLEGPHQPRVLPSQLIDPADGDLVWLLDRAAAAQLTTG